MVLAVVALGVALGGTSYAITRLPRNSVGTRQIKNKAVTLNKIGTSARKSLRGQTGAQGPQGLQGSTGTVDSSNFYDKATSDSRLLATGATATDAAKLGGKDPSAYLAQCPAGMGRAADLCYETSLRTASVPASAMSTCGSSGRMLPSMGQLSELFSSPTDDSPKPFPAAPEPLLTSDFSADQIVKSPSVSAD